MDEMINENELEANSTTVGAKLFNGIPSTKNFSLSEFHCKDGTKVPKQFYSNLQTLMNQLQIIRDYVKKPILINSAYRSPAHNTKIGGAKSSQHLTASAADIVIVGMSARDVQNTLKQLMNAGTIINGGLGSYPNFTHYDIGNPRKWSLNERLLCILFLCTWRSVTLWITDFKFRSFNTERSNG
jgi:hypothetical protein